MTRTEWIELCVETLVSLGFSISVSTNVANHYYQVMRCSKRFILPEDAYIEYGCTF